MQLDHRIVMLNDINIDPPITTTQTREELAISFVKLGGNFVNPPILIEDGIENYSVFSGAEQIYAAKDAAKENPHFETTNAFFIYKKDEQLVTQQIALLATKPKTATPKRKKTTKLQQINSKLHELTGNTSIYAKRYTKKSLGEIGIVHMRHGYYLIEAGKELSIKSIILGYTLDETLDNLEDKGDMPLESRLLRKIKGKYSLSKDNSDIPTSSTGSALVPVATKPLQSVVQQQLQAQTLPLVIFLPCDVPTYTMFASKQQVVMMPIFIRTRLDNFETEWNNIPTEEIPTHSLPLIIEGEATIDEQKKWPLLEKDDEPKTFQNATACMIIMEHFNDPVLQIARGEFPELFEYCEMPDKDGQFRYFTKPISTNLLEVGMKVWLPLLEAEYPISAIQGDEIAIVTDDEYWYFHREVLIPHEDNIHQIQLQFDELENKLEPWVVPVWGNQESNRILPISNWEVPNKSANMPYDFMPPKKATTIVVVKQKGKTIEPVSQYPIPVEKLEFPYPNDIDPHLSIGASRIANLCDFGYSSQLEEYLQMKGELTPLSKNKKKIFGLLHESAILETYKLTTGREITDHQKLFSDENLRIHCHVDAISVDEVNGTRIVVDAKYSSEFMMNRQNANGTQVWGDDGSDVFPAQYHFQLQQQMLLTGCTRADLAVQFGNVDFRVYSVDAEPKIQKMIKEKAQAFWELMDTDTPPQAENHHDVKILYKDQLEKETVQLSSAACEAIATKEASEAKIKELQAEIESARMLIENEIGSAEVGICADGRKITRKLDKNGNMRIYYPKGEKNA